MSAVAVTQSSLSTSLARYLRSRALWIMLIVAPIGARYMLPQDDGGGIKIAIGDKLPEMTSPFLGVSLGIIVSTLLLPVAWLYLRSNTTRRQPWQVEEVTTGSRVAIALGRFGADVAVLLALLAALNLAGLYLALFIHADSGLNAGELSLALWLVAAPALIGLAALRILFDARPLLRSGFGDFAYFCLWIASIAAPIEHGTPGFATNMRDFAGFVTPLTIGAPTNSNSFSIGGGFEVNGRVHLDVMAGLLSAGYIESRFAWIGIAILVVIIAGLIYLPHRPRRTRTLGGRLGKLLSAGAPPRVVANAPPAKPSFAPLLDLVIAEFRLIGAGRIYLVMAALVLAIAFIGDFRHAASPGALLLLVFALSAHAGRSEAAGLIALARTAPLSPMLRRAAFVVAGAAWSVLLVLPALVRGGSVQNWELAAGTGGVAALIAIGLASLTGSAFAPRLVLLVIWYGYASAH